MKAKALVESKRFWIGAGSLVVYLLFDSFGLDRETATQLVALAGAWIVGDSIRPTENPLTSRRTWGIFAGILAAAAKGLGIQIDDVTMNTLILALASWVIGDSWRETLHGPAKQKQYDWVLDRQAPIRSTIHGN